MKSSNSDTRPLTLADIFLMVLEQMAQDEEKKHILRRYGR